VVSTLQKYGLIWESSSQGFETSQRHGQLECLNQWLGFVGKILTGNHGFYHEIYDETGPVQYDQCCTVPHNNADKKLLKGLIFTETIPDSRLIRTLSGWFWLVVEPNPSEK